MKFVLLPVLLTVCTYVSAQSTALDFINFYDDAKFTSKTYLNLDGGINYIEYDQINGNLKKIDYYRSDGRVDIEKIWKAKLVREIKYSYIENGQIIKRYDVLNKTNLTPVVKMFLKYPALARENGIEGIAKYKLIFDDDCIPISFQVLSELGNGIEEELDKKLRTMIQFSKKYNIPTVKCGQAKDTLEVRFKLEYRVGKGDSHP